MKVTQDSKDKDNVTNGFTRRGVRFKPPTPPSSSYGGDSLDFETIFSRLPPHYYCGTWRRCMEPPKGLGGIQRAVGTILMDDFIQKFDN
jgi:hypothetical protein